MTPTEFAEVVCQTGNKRSEAYKRGVAAFAAHQKFADSINWACPYLEGSAEFDAFFHGVDRGRAVIIALRHPAHIEWLTDAERTAWAQLQKEVAA